MISAEAFVRAYRAYEPCRVVVNRHYAMSIAEGRQLTACSAVHEAGPRLCRWLSNARDQTGMDDLQLTQELVGQMLGLRRPTVSYVCGELQANGIIEKSRGHIKILNPDQLRDRACECYGILRERSSKLFPQRRPQPRAAPR